MRPVSSVFSKPNSLAERASHGITETVTSAFDLMMPLEKLAIVHAIKMIAGKNQQRVDAPVANVRQDLSHCVGSALKPLRAFGRLFRGEYLDKAV